MERLWNRNVKEVPVQSRSRQVAVTGLLMPDAVDTVTWAPDDGWRHHPKHVERFTDINKLGIVASCWTITGTYIYFTMHGPLNVNNFNFGLRTFITCAMICFRGLHVSFQKQKFISKAYNICAYGKHADLFNSISTEEKVNTRRRRAACNKYPPPPPLKKDWYNLSDTLAKEAIPNNKTYHVIWRSVRLTTVVVEKQ